MTVPDSQKFLYQAVRGPLYRQPRKFKIVEHTKTFVFLAEPVWYLGKCSTRVRKSQLNSTDSHPCRQSPPRLTKREALLDTERSMKWKLADQKARITDANRTIAKVEKALVAVQKAMKGKGGK
jgi:hypothetical protein